MTLPLYLRLTAELGFGLKEAMLMEISAVYELYRLRFDKLREGR